MLLVTLSIQWLDNIQANLDKLTILMFSTRFLPKRGVYLAMMCYAYSKKSVENKYNMTLNDYYEIYIPTKHPTLKVMCDRENEHNLINYDFTDIKDYAINNPDVTICDIFLLLNKDKMTAFCNSPLDGSDDIILVYINNNHAWSDLRDKLKEYYGNGFYRPTQPFSPNRIVTLEGLYGTYLLSKNNYSDTLYYSATHNNYNVPINTHICPDLLSAIHYCVEEEFGILIRKSSDFINGIDNQ